MILQGRPTSDYTQDDSIMRAWLSYTLLLNKANPMSMTPMRRFDSSCNLLSITPLLEGASAPYLAACTCAVVDFSRVSPIDQLQGHLILEHTSK